MSTVQRVAKNTGVIIVGNIIFRIISIFVIIYLARYLGPAEFGKYNFVFAYLAFFAVITDLGLQPILVREMSRDPATAPKLIGNAYIIRLILTALGVVLPIIVISFMSYPADTTTYIYISAFALLFISFSDFYATIFAANLRMEYNIIAKLAFKVLSAALILWIILSHGTLLQIIIVLVFSEMVKTLINYYFSRKLLRPKFAIDFELWKYLFKEALPIAFYSIIWILYYRIDVVMLSMMMGDAPVGIYSAAYKLSEPLSLIPEALAISLLPIMSASLKSSNERLINTYGLAIRYLLIAILPIAIGTTLIADKIIFLIYGVEFAGSTTALQILIWALVFTSMNYALATILLSVGKQKLSTVSIALCAVVNVALNFILIPTLSYNGASIATVATNAVLFMASFYFVSKHLQVLPIHKILVKPVLSGLVMGAFVYYFVDLNIFLLIPLAGIVYFVALLALKTFSKDDWSLVKRIVSRR
jgi:O-antigen/teichoic acid export membrane protein